MNKRILSRLGVLFALSAMLPSCFDNEVDLVGYGDAYILVETVGQDTVKGLGLHAYSYSDFSSVVVNLNGNPAVTYTLAPYLNYTQDYVWSTPLAQYTKTLPVSGDYVFNATFAGGESLIFYDKLTTNYINPPHITLCEYVTKKERVDLEWNDVPNADAYNVKLIDQQGNYLFVSQAFTSSITNYSLGTSTKGWQSETSYPSQGQVVTVEVAAYLLEENSGSDELQCISKSRQNITWGSL